MKVSFIVSAFNRPHMLNVCLASLQNQTWADRQVIVADNSRMHFLDQGHEPYARRYGGQHVFTTGARDCYESANMVAKSEFVSGQYLCFPSDDCYYAPRFLELMLRHGDGADLIYCDCVWDGRGYGPGEELIHLDCAPRRGKIDKGGFLVNRELFLGLGGFQGPFGVDRCEDGLFIERVVASGASIKKVGIVGWMHN